MIAPSALRVSSVSGRPNIATETTVYATVVIRKDRELVLLQLELEFAMWFV